jgi:VanZ family protein
MTEKKGPLHPQSPRLTPSLVLSYWLPVLLWAAFIFYLSSVPHLRFMKNELWDLVVRKLGHFGVFGILARFLARAWTGTTYWPWRKIFTLSLLLTFLYACSDEGHQSFVAGRKASPVDVAIDTTGAWLALGLIP